MHHLLCVILACWIPTQDEDLKLDFTRISQPAIASRIELSDAQRSKVAELLTDRINKLAASKPADRSAIRDANNAALKALLSPTQLQKYREIVAGSNLRFNFRGEKWSNVLTWFAQQAELSLVMDDSPSGDFTYADQKEYTATQAIDLLNSVLLSKGYTLIRREKMLIVVNLKVGIPYELVPTETLEGLAKRGKFEWVRVKFPLAGRPVQAVLDEVTPLISDHGKVTPLPANGQLMVTETAGKMEGISVLISAVPVPTTPPAPPKPVPPPPNVFVVYPVKGMDVEATVENLKALFGVSAIFGDTASEELQVYAPQAQQDLIKSSLDQMIKNASDELKAYSDIYAVEDLSLDDVQAQLTELFADAKITRDSENNRLVVLANKKVHRGIQETLDKLGVQPANSTESTVVVYTAPKGQGADIANVLTEMLPRAQVIVQQDRVAVRGKAADHRVAKELVEQIANASRQVNAPQIRFYELNSSQPDVSETIQSMVKDGTVTWLESQGKLAVIADESTQQLVQKTIEQINLDLPKKAQRKLKIYAASPDQKERFEDVLSNLTDEFPGVKLIQGAAPDELAILADDKQHQSIAELIDSLGELDSFKDRNLFAIDISVEDTDQLLSLLADRFPSLQFIVNPQKDSLLVWTQPLQFEDIKKQVAAIEKLLPKRETPSLEIYPIRGAFTEIESLLTPLLQNAKVTSDTGNRRLIVWATSSEHKRIQELLAKIDTGVDSVKMLRVYRVPDGNLEIATQMINNLEMDADVTPAADAKSLLVRAKQDSHDRVKKLLDQLADLDSSERVGVEIFAIDRSNAESTLAAVQAVFPNANISLNGSSRKIISIADEETQGQIKALIEKLQPEGLSAPPILMSYELKHSEAAVVVSMLEELHPDVRFAADERANRVLVTAELTEQPRFKAMITQLDARSSDRSEKNIQKYPVGILSAEVVTELVQPMFPDMKITMDVKSGQLVVLGTPFDHQKLAMVLQQLGSKKNASEKRLDSYSTGEIPIEEVRNILMQVVPSAVIAANPNEKKIVVWATAEELKLIEAAMNQIGSKPVDMTLKTYDLAQPISAEITTLLQGMSRTARIAASADGKQLVVFASGPEQKMFDDAIKELQSAELLESELKAYTGSTTLIQDVQAFVASNLPDARIVDQPEDNKLLVWATAADHVRIAKAVADLGKQLSIPAEKKTIVIYPLGKIDRSTALQLIEKEVERAESLTDSQTGRIILRATKSDHEKVSQLIDELKKTFSIVKEKVIKSHPVRKDIKSQAVTTVTSLIPTVEFIANQNATLILAKASPDDHLAIASLIKTLETEISGKEPGVIRAYRMEQIDRSLIEQILSERFEGISIVDDSNPTRILVWATKAVHDQVPDLIRDLESTFKAESEMTVQVYNIDSEKMAAGDVVELLDAKLRENTTIQIANTTNSLVVRTTADRHSVLKKAIDAVVMQIKVAPKPTARVFEVPGGNAQAYADLVAPLIPDASISVAADGKRLAVTSGVDDQQLVESVIQQLESKKNEDGKETVVYRLNAAIPSLMQTAVNAMTPDADVIADDNSRSLIISANAKEHAAISNVIKQVNDSTLGKRTEVFTMRVADPTSLVGAISDQVPEASVTADEPTKSIVVTARETEFPQIQAIVDKLDTVAGELQKKMISRVYPFDQDVVDAVDMQSVIDPRLREGMSVRVNEIGNGLIIRATSDQHEQLKTVFDQIIQQMPKKKTIETRVYRLEKADPAAIANVLGARYSKTEFSVDPNTRTVVATLSLEEQEKVKSILNEMESQPAGKKAVSKAFNLKKSTARVVADAIEALLPAANVTFDTASNSVIVTGTTEEIQSASELVTQVDSSNVSKITEVYRLKEADPRFVAPAIEAMIADAEVSADRYSKSLFVTATDKQHEQIAKMVEEINGKEGQRSEVYRLAKADPRYVMPAVQSLLPDATVSADRVSRSLFVTGSDKDHEQVRTLIEKLNGEGTGITTEVYKLEKANPVIVAPAIESLIPDGTVTADRLSSTIVVSASAEDQQKVADVVQKLDTATDEELVLKIYKSKFDNPEPLNQSIGNMFRDDKQVRINYEWENRRLMIVATEAKHKLIETLIEQVDQAKPDYDHRFAKVYHLENIESKAAEGVVRNLYGWWTPRIDVRIEEGTNALIVVATDEQHKQLGPAVKEVDGDLRQLEVFQLVNVDPFTVEQAVEQLFAEIPENMRPAATSDFGTQQLFVRGTTAQIKLIREMLVKMGERFDDETQPVSRGGVRTIPFRGNAMDALREIEAIWPRIRKNKIEIIRPGNTKINRLRGRGERVNQTGPESTPKKQDQQKPAQDDPAQSNAGDGCEPIQEDELLKKSQDDLQKQEQKAAEPKIKIEPLNPVKKNSSASSRNDSSSEQDDPQIVIIPGDNEITIASSDLEALDQLEYLLRTLQRSQRGGIGSSNFAVYLLANSSASDTAKLLSELFDAIPDTERQGSVGNAIFVADERLNAMIVYGTRKERDVIREIIEVLDAEDLPDSLTTPLPELVQIANSSADRVLKILEKVYSNQLSSGGGRKKVDIPEGVSSAVATLLQQINAATSGPILTLGVDEKTNSIVMRAPAELGREIKSFIERLDEAASATVSRRVRVLQIQGTNASRLQSILNSISQEDQ